MKWIYTPHVPHGWDCGDLFTQPGANIPAVTESEILSASEGMRGMMDYYAHATSTSRISAHPLSLANTAAHFRGDGAALLRELATTLEKSTA